MGEVGTDNACFSGAGESKSEVACSTAQIKDESIGPCEYGPQALGGAGAPEAIELQGK